MISRRLLLATFVVVLLLVGGAALRRGWRDRDPFVEALSHRGVVATVGVDGLGLGRPTGTELRDAARSSPLTAALASRDAARVEAAMRGSGARALLVATRATARRGADVPIGERLAALDVVPGFRAEAISASAALYVREPSLGLSAAEREALPRVARLVLGGTPPPLSSQFPPGLRAPRPVEVLVIVRDRDGTPKLWRSARGASIASAMLTALASARDRWSARALALGGSAETALADCDVEVGLLLFDGTLVAHTREVANRAITGVHGVGYQSPSDWRYVLPEMLRRERVRSGAAAFEELFRDNGLPLDSLRREDLRFYRLRVESLGVSRAPGPEDDLPLDDLSAPSLPPVPADALKPEAPADASRAATPARPGDGP